MFMFMFISYCIINQSILFLTLLINNKQLLQGQREGTVKRYYMYFGYVYVVKPMGRVSFCMNQWVMGHCCDTVPALI